MGKSANYSQQNCAAAAALQVLGEPWTLLIIGGAFAGLRRFEEWCEQLGLARNVLAQRLRTLVELGLMERRQYCDKPARFEYILTPKGRDTHPVLMALNEWGVDHVYGRGKEPYRYYHRECGHLFELAPTCACCGEAVNNQNLISELNEPAPRAVAKA